MCGSLTTCPSLYIMRVLAEEKKLTRIPLVTASEEGKAQILNLPGSQVELYFEESISVLRSGSSSLEQDIMEGENPVHDQTKILNIRFLRVELFGNAAQIGW
ncbi:hypothetical protein Glove_335g34 [Diversispora epigaea]|uniref:Uncharacterized protein n=1 Tax=Diversispora epigaea TaxID=1348612 RepID=A0A397HQK2_9GLOM|nr:hypothetical protein Glove_335g34 [Diversispora epigaea]